MHPNQDKLPKVIELKNVSFRYEENQPYVLENFNLAINPGEHLAVVGLNGAGKTTLVKLICGLIDPTEGQVLYDGKSIAEYDRVELYRMYSAVFQQFSIMPVTVEEIVAEAPAAQVDSERVKKCLELAGMWERIQNYRINYRVNLEGRFMRTEWNSREVKRKNFYLQGQCTNPHRLCC